MILMPAELGGPQATNRNRQSTLMEAVEIGEEAFLNLVDFGIFDINGREFDALSVKSALLWLISGPTDHGMIVCVSCILESK